MHTIHVARMHHAAYTSGMTVALGGYVKTLRLRQGLTKAEVLRRIEKEFGEKRTRDRSSYYRLEKGEHWPDSDFLTALLGVIGGQVEDLVYFLGNPKAEELEGCERADAWLRDHGKPADITTIVQAQSRPDAEEIAEELEELARKIRAGLE